MDRKTVIGLGLIGAILIAFTYFNQPSEEEIQQRIAQQELLVEQQKQIAESQESEITKNEQSTFSVDSATTDVGNTDSSALQIQPIQNITPINVNKEEETFTLENEELEVILSSYGGGVKSVYLKNHQTYNDYMINRESGKITPLKLFEEDGSSNGLVINVDGKDINTKDLIFNLHKQTDNYISFVSYFDANKTKYVEQIYTITPDQFHLDYEIKIKGFNSSVNPDDILITWETDMLKTEKSTYMERMVSTVFYQETEGSKYNYLSETKSDDLVAETDMDWIAFKQSYFSAIMIPKKPFKKKGTVLKIEELGESSPKDQTHIKHYFANINPGFTNASDDSIEMQWYFGPNDYDLLKTYNNGTHNLLNYGWGLFRWMNVYLIQPLFVWLVQYGMGMGIAILILTIIVKLVLTPIQWKMYVSSAKMRILKPEIEEINKKYPEKDQAMEKQMEMMNLYKETGSSPLAGCLPALIQMPILVAVFRFFPSTFLLRQESFLWAEDLSSFDSILDLGFNIPLYGSHISLFTLLMAGTTLIYTFLNSSNQMSQASSQPGMPNMKIIMYLMPIMMVFWFNSYASGLSYYYFVSTLMSILIMVAIKNFFVDEDKLRAKMEERKANQQAQGKKKGKSKFAQRLEEMQRLQQERLKEKQKNK